MGTIVTQEVYGINAALAADAASRIYRSAGIRSACVNLGGNVAVVGKKPDGTRWIVGVRSPFGGRDECIGFYEAEDCSAVTSGGYERFVEHQGKRYHHIIDPRNGRPSESDVASVTVISGSSTEADALSTTAFILGMEEGIRLIESRQSARAVFVSARGEVRAIGDMEGRWHMSESGGGANAHAASCPVFGRASPARLS